MSEYMPVTYNNVVEAERDFGGMSLLAVSRETGEVERINSDVLSLFKVAPDMTLADSEGNPMVMALGSPSVLIQRVDQDIAAAARELVAEVFSELFEITEDYAAFDRLERRGYFNR